MYNIQNPNADTHATGDQTWYTIKSIYEQIKPEYLSIHLFLAVPFFAGLEKMGKFEDI